jgi:ribonuclease P protein component
MEKRSSKKKIASLKRKEDFLEVYHNSLFYVGKFMVLYSKNNHVHTHRLGIVISKKVGNSVKRNKIRRIIKEVFKDYENHFKQFNDFVIVGRKSDVFPDYNQIKKEMKYLLKKLELITVENENY